MISAILVGWMVWCESLEESIINICLSRDGIGEDLRDTTFFSPGSWRMSRSFLRVVHAGVTSTVRVRTWQYECMQQIEEMVHNLMWLDCKMGKEGTRSEVGKLGAL